MNSRPMAEQCETAIRESQVTNSKHPTKDRENISINRERFNELEIEQALSPKALPPPLQRVLNAMVPPEPVLSGIKPPMTREAWLRFLLTHLPILHWLWTYKIQYLFSDIIAGISVALLHVPQGLAFGLLAGLDPVYGLYTSFVPVIMYSIFGTSKHLSIGTFPVVSLLVKNSVNTVLVGKGFDYCSSINHRLTVVLFEDGSNITCNDLKVQIAVSLAFTSGLIMVVMGILKMGFVTLLLSDSLISGYITASAMLVIASQLSLIFGLSFQITPLTALFPSLMSFPRTVIEVCREVFQWPKYVNTAAFVASLISFIILIILDLTNNKLIARIKICCCIYSRNDKKCHTHKKLPFPLRIPIAMVLVIFSIGVSSGIDYEHRWNGTVVGTVPTRLPPISLPRPEYMLASLPNAILIAIVIFAISVSVADLLAKKYNYSINSSQELIAYGISNVIGSLFNSYCSAASISRSVFQADSRGKTQFTSLVSSVVICVVLISLASVFQKLPVAVLGAIVCMWLSKVLVQFKDVVTYFQTSTPDLLAWLVVFIATLLLGVDLGLIAGVVFSLLIVIIRIGLPYSAELGQVPGTEIFRTISEYEKINTIPGLLIFQFQAPLCFLSSYVFRRRLEQASQIDRMKWEKKNESIVKKLITKLSHFYRSIGHDEDIIQSSSEHCNGTAASVAGSAESNKPSGVLHTIIIDCSPIGFLDAVGVKTLIQIVQDFGVAGTQVVIAAMSKENRDMLERSGFYKKFGKEWLFPTIQDAVEFAKCGASLLQAQPTEIGNTELEDNKIYEEAFKLSSIGHGIPFKSTSV